jgi:hypothetical protein
MSITYGQAKKILAPYQARAGKCADAEGTDFFVRQVLEYLLISGENGSIRKFTFHAVKGCFTVPFELEVPLKVKIDGEVGNVWDRWFEWHNRKNLDEGCVPADEALYEDPNYYPTVYDVPPGGTQVGVIGTCNESDDAHVIVQGIDGNGRDIYTVHKGVQVKGEYLRISRGQIRYTTKKFYKIAEVLKTRTVGYVQLLWVVVNDDDTITQGMLADYSPVEENPQYRRYHITSRHCTSAHAHGTSGPPSETCHAMKVSLLGRIRLKPAYADNDLIPFDNILALTLGGQFVNSNTNNDMQTAQAKDSILQNVITKENEHKRVNNGQPVEFYKGTCAGLIKNIV